MRRKLLEAASAEVHRNGFQGASLNAIVAAAGATKGALFHHFASKQELGYVLVEDVLGPGLLDRWLEPLARSDDPIGTIQRVVRDGIAHDLAEGQWVLGCPVNNLAQEMSVLDEGFRQRLQRVYSVWRGGVADALARGQRAGTVRADADVRGAAALVVLAHQGIWGTGKYSQDRALMAEAGEALCAYLETLRPAPPAPHPQERSAA